MKKQFIKQLIKFAEDLSDKEFDAILTRIAEANFHPDGTVPFSMEEVFSSLVDSPKKFVQKHLYRHAIREIYMHASSSVIEKDFFVENRLDDFIETKTMGITNVDFDKMQNIQDEIIVDYGELVSRA